MRIKVAFDASIDHNTKCVGVGIYDMTNKTRISKIVDFYSGNNSDKSERVAYFEALKYAKGLGCTGVLFFTDNLGVSKEKSPLIDIYMRGIDFKTTWDPRELNKEADKLSKLAKRTVNSNLAPDEENHILKDDKYNFLKMPFTDRISLLGKLSRTKTEKEFIRLITSQEKANYDFDTTLLEKGEFYKFALSIIEEKELSPYAQKRIKFKENLIPNMEFDSLWQSSFIRENINSL